MNNAKILYVGSLDYGSTSLQRMGALKRLGMQVYPIETYKNLDIFSRIFNKIGYPLDNSNVNSLILLNIEKIKPNVLWIDKGLTIKEATFIAVKKISSKTKIIGYSGDDMYQRHSQSKYFIDTLKYYDYFYTTKSYNVAELKQMGAKNPIYIANAFDPEIHRKLHLSSDEIKKYGGDVGFIGAWELERAESILALANAGIKVRWWGWEGNKKYENIHQNLKMENKPLWGYQYSQAINSFKINLCFLRKINRDLQTTRSIEIPACGGFMLAERTNEHLELFKEDKEACFFSSRDELIDKVKFYLQHTTVREQIALAGYQKCINSGYSNDERLKKVFVNLSFDN